MHGCSLCHGDRSPHPSLLSLLLAPCLQGAGPGPTLSLVTGPGPTSLLSPSESGWLRWHLPCIHCCSDRLQPPAGNLLCSAISSCAHAAETLQALGPGHGKGLVLLPQAGQTGAENAAKAGRSGQRKNTVPAAAPGRCLPRLTSAGTAPPGAQVAASQAPSSKRRNKQGCTRGAAHPLICLPCPCRSAGLGGTPKGQA